jgi:hypothetical protein
MKRLERKLNRSLFTRTDGKFHLSADGDKLLESLKNELVTGLMSTFNLRVSGDFRPKGDPCARVNYPEPLQEPKIQEKPDDECYCRMLKRKQVESQLPKQNRQTPE